MKKITEFSKSKIRYALYRVRDDRNPEPEHLEIANFYLPQLEEHDFTIEDFNRKWDIDLKSVDKIIYGKAVKDLNRKIQASLFIVE